MQYRVTKHRRTKYKVRYLVFGLFWQSLIELKGLFWRDAIFSSLGEAEQAISDHAAQQRRRLGIVMERTL